MGSQASSSSSVLAAVLRLPNPALVKKYLQIADGRDKALKIVQYLFKVILWAGWVTKKSHPVLHPRVAAVVAQFSLTRRVLRLGHCVEPYAEVRDQVAGGWAPANRSVHAQFLHLLSWYNPVASVVNDVVDDIICLAKIGALDKSWSKRLDTTSTRLWFSTILIDVYENYRGQAKLVADVVRRERDLAALHASSASPVAAAAVSKGEREVAIETAHKGLAAAKQKLFMQRVSFFKLLADFTFCWVDFREMSGDRADGIQAVAGFCAALLATYKIWVKCQ
ncbi:hypothetical protein H9P43_004778 [Blastocladiella emersonii ATCC 22665]|nr:hypothetical protein H9P43_004778 [Blastocladiella emersonii ATCC 22665]